MAARTKQIIGKRRIFRGNESKDVPMSPSFKSLLLQFLAFLIYWLGTQNALFTCKKLRFEGGSCKITKKIQC